MADRNVPVWTGFFPFPRKKSGEFEEKILLAHKLHNIIGANYDVLVAPVKS